MSDVRPEYGNCPPWKRFAMDQVPLEFGGRGQTYNVVGAGECFIRGAKHDMEKRQATLILTFRAVPPYLVKPIIAFRAVPKWIELPNGLYEIDPSQASAILYGPQ